VDASTASSSTRVVVDTSYGTIQGFEKDGCLVFRGVPYADAPTRFRRPAEARSWGGVLDCGRYGKMAVQPLVNPKSMKLAKWLVLRATGILPMQPPEWEVQPEVLSEDCLSLNITTPSLHGQRPVLCWIHGGAFVLGSGSQLVYRGIALSKHEDVVLVTINYRLGCFGFLNVPGGDANCGSWDQLQALRWINKEIHRFGGDPTRVTICGQSAGAMSCGVLLTSPLAQPFFQRAILMSGALSNVMSNEDATAVGRMFCEKAGTPFDAEALRGLTAEQLLNVQAQLPGAMPYQPCVDRELIPDLPLQTLATGVVCLKSKQVMLGCTAREFNLFSPFNVSLRRKPLEDVLKKSVADLGSKRMALASSVEEQSCLEAELRDLLTRVRMARGMPNWTEVE